MWCDIQRGVSLDHPKASRKQVQQQPTWHLHSCVLTWSGNPSNTGFPRALPKYQLVDWGAILQAPCCSIHQFLRSKNREALNREFYLHRAPQKVTTSNMFEYAVYGVISQREICQQPSNQERSLRNFLLHIGPSQGKLIQMLLLTRNSSCKWGS
jgi:hypothetical protein